MDINYTEVGIREWDIRSANISILASKELISEDLYWDLLEGSKTHRNVIVGKLIRDDIEIYSLLQDGFDEYVTKFVTKNHIRESSIVERNKDAIFIQGSDGKNVEFTIFDDFVKFIPKSDYISLLEFNPTDGSNIMIKLYLNAENISTPVTCRYGTLNEDHVLYDYIGQLLLSKYEGDNKRYNQQLRQMIRVSSRPEAEDKVLSTCTNERLIEAFRELSLL